MSLRLRVALASVAATALVLLLAGIALVAIVDRQQRRSVDDLLTAQIAPATVAIDDIGRRSAPAVAGPRTNVGARRTGLALGTVTRVTVNDEVFFSTDDFPEIGVADQPGFRTSDLDGTSWRVLTREVERPGPVEVLIEVAAPLDDALQTSRRVAFGGLWLGAIATMLAGAIGYFFGNLALRPVTQLRGDAERIARHGASDARVSTGHGAPEVDALASSLNQMLAQIDAAQGHTRDALGSSRAFAANVAHELRTPLTSMVTNLDVLQRNPDLDETMRNEVLADIASEQQRLLATLETLRLLARGDLAAERPSERVDLLPLIEQAVAGARRRHDGVAEIDLVDDESTPSIDGWPEGIDVMVRNLVDNAVLHGRSADGISHVTVTLSTDATGHPSIAVADRGPGIPAQDRARLLQRFERGATATPGSGSGLGLALVAQQVALHGAELFIGEGSPARSDGSNDDRGARITVVFGTDNRVP